MGVASNKSYLGECHGSSFWSSHSGRVIHSLIVDKGGQIVRMASLSQRSRVTLPNNTVSWHEMHMSNTFASRNLGDLYLRIFGTSLQSSSSDFHLLSVT